MLLRCGILMLLLLPQQTQPVCMVLVRAFILGSIAFSPMTAFECLVNKTQGF